MKNAKKEVPIQESSLGKFVRDHANQSNHDKKQKPPVKHDTQREKNKRDQNRNS